MDNTLVGVAGWLATRAAAAPPHLADAWRQRAALYRQSIGLSHPMRQYLFAMTKIDPDFDTSTLTRPVVDRATAAGLRFSGPPDLLTIELTGELGTFDTAELEAHILRAANIRLHLDTNGGDFMQAMRLYRLLSAKNTTAIVTGRAFSAGALVLQSAKRRCAKPNAQIMVHGAHAFVAGNSAELRQAAEGNDLADQIQREILTARTGQPQRVVESWLARDSYFSATEALAVGLIDTILDYASHGTPPT